MSHPNDLAWTRNIRSQPEVDQEDDLIYNVEQQQLAREEVYKQAYEIVAILTQRLNEDVARMIVLQLELSEAWRERQRPSQELGIMENNSPQPCFVSSAIESKRIQKIDFRIESHDQGWVTHRDGGSWSWFTVCVVPDNDLDIEDGAYVGGSTCDRIWRIDLFDSLTTPPYHRDHPISSMVQRERDLIRNNVASRTFELHQISWSADSEDPDEAAWVRSLQLGERILVRAWAKYGGWSNHVRSVSMTVHSSLLL